MPNKVNIDALIERQDFEVVEATDGDDKIGDKSDFIRVIDLEKSGTWLRTFRKPDFQRETSDWDPSQVCGLIQSLIDEDLIPALILWRSPSNTIFVIDGCHRLSALIAWVNDDYGDGEISKKFYDNKIPGDQVKYAEKTRRLVNKQVGAYKRFRSQNPEKGIDEKIARLLTFVSIRVQWVPGNASKAEQSFFKINKSATPISPSELTILQSRSKANAIAARAILRQGTGYRHWSRFGEPIKSQIELCASQIYNSLFTPELDDPLTNVEMPVAGKGYSNKSLELIYDFVSVCNGAKTLSEGGAKPSPIKRGKKLKATSRDSAADAKPTVTDENDSGGERTFEFLQKSLDVTRRITGKEASSLGLHPAVYFYRQDGKFDKYLFLSFVSLFNSYLRADNISDKLQSFIDSRFILEQFLINYKSSISASIVYSRSGQRVAMLRTMFDQIISTSNASTTLVEVVKLARSCADQKVSWKMDSELAVEMEAKSKKFSNRVKSQAIISKYLNNPTIICATCRGLVPSKSQHHDHVKPQRDGGMGVLTNNDIKHPYCNSVIKR